MKIVSNPIDDRLLHKIIRGLVLGSVIATAFAVSSYAADRRGRGWEQHRPVAVDRDWREHEGRAHRYWRRPEPGVIYAPPVVYEPPPEYESPGINFIIPLHIR
ncbi:MAG: hypothetical protein P4M13_10760 [Alphaproteobacteria bacterium]|nr:hypothetical protein [Alphaproteobacteria bacterium]